MPIAHNKPFVTNTNVYIHTHTHTHTKLTYFEHPNKIVEHPNLRITRV